MCMCAVLPVAAGDDYVEDEKNGDADEDQTRQEDDERAIKIQDAKEWFKQHKSDQHVGRSADIDYLSINSPGVRPVFGMAGVGKSYIVKYVYYKQVIDRRTSPFEKFGWVDVSHPFNIRDFSWRLLLDLYSGSLQHGSMLRIRDPIQECCRLLKKCACLIVIDGLQSTEEWDLIKTALAIEDNQDRSRIIVIANEESVASHCSPRWWSVEGLEIDDALELFKKTLYRPGTSWSSRPELSPAEIETVKPVLHKCGGLPKLIVAVAEFINNEGWNANLDYYFMQMLETNQGFGSLRDLFSWVHSYFQSCPDSLKPCIFYLSIFPADHNIRRRRLVRRWIAEGYSKDNKENTAEEKGGEFFENLCHRNMVQVPGSTSLSYLTRMSSCHVNGFFREYIMSRSMEENLVFALEGHCSVNAVQHTGRHLTIGSSWDRDKSVYQSIDLSRLRSLTVFGKWKSFFISDKMSLVRVLDLEDASSVTDADLEVMVELLPRLKFLSLRRCKEITHLPDSIGRHLRQLQTIDIRHTSIVQLPPSITMLQKLQHISAGSTVPMEDYSTTTATSVESLPPPPVREAATTGSSSFQRLWTRHGQRLLPKSFSNGGIRLPQGIGKMTALHNISILDVSIIVIARRRPNLEELKNLTQLRKLGVSGVNGENSKELCSAISGHPHLESLSVWLNTDQDGCLDAISPPPEQLENLKIYGHVGKLPAWTKLLSNLRKMKLRLTMITQDEVDLLANLTSLHTLCLCFKEFQYGELRFRGFRSFRQLLVLEIACNCRIQSITFESKVMWSLEVLKIHCSNLSSLKFSGLKELEDLREVSLHGSYDDKLKQHLLSQLGEHPKEIKPVLKPN
ncbi:hypothetical protein U9M48_001696 [Paspalum notatum var. saurae]|uniref:NB-ARC domain-containing protein n=1 Tax=Paspalum notatum var. saurae TaxID=547442 RepID=A0AAQ3PG48_PASNO